MKIYDDDHQSIDANWEFLNALWTDGMCANLQVVQINNYIRWLPLSFVKLILSKASLLHTLSVDVCPVSQDDPQNELLKCRRASAQAQVLFKGKKLGTSFYFPQFHIFVFCLNQMDSCLIFRFLKGSYAQCSRYILLTIVRARVIS